MYLCRLSVEGFKCCSARFEIGFAPGLNVLVGGNGSGKSAIVDAVRLLLQGNDPGRADFSDTSFHRPFGEGTEAADRATISARFADLTDEEQIAFLPWTDLGAEATLTLDVENRLTARDRYKRSLWGGASSNAAFEWELMDTINCAYLPPLRDAEARLREGRGSRLARLLRNLSGMGLRDRQADGLQHPLSQKVASFQRELAGDDAGLITKANSLIRERLRSAVGDVFGQNTAIRFSETSFSRIVESLRLLFFPSLDDTVPTDAFRGLEENSLGYNNLLYLATVLAELGRSADGETEYLRILLIEEPEAHLHPQLQIRLLKFLEREARKDGLQVIITTHSPVLASAVAIDSITHVSRCDGGPEAIRLSDCGLPPASSSFISRWLDATKSTLLFAKGVILVEGIAEALLLPELARRVIREHNGREGVAPLPKSLEDAGVSVINMNGIYFQHFMQLFCDLSGEGGRHLPVRCAGITDKDPPRKARPTRANPVRGRNPALSLVSRVSRSETCRLYPCEYKTLEYDLAMEGMNLTAMATVLSALRPGWNRDGPVGARHGEAEDGDDGPDDLRARAAAKLLGRVESDSGIGKGLFAQALAEELSADEALEFAVPAYIRDAVLWVLGVHDGRA